MFVSTAGCAREGGHVSHAYPPLQMHTIVLGPLATNAYFAHRVGWTGLFSCAVTANSAHAADLQIKRVATSWQANYLGKGAKAPVSSVLCSKNIACMKS